MSLTSNILLNAWVIVSFLLGLIFFSIIFLSSSVNISIGLSKPPLQGFRVIERHGSVFARCAPAESVESRFQLPQLEVSLADQVIDALISRIELLNIFELA